MNPPGGTFFIRVSYINLAWIAYVHSPME